MILKDAKALDTYPEKSHAQRMPQRREHDVIVTTLLAILGTGHYTFMDI